ncbi:serine/threonine protein kinase [Planctomycetota bacterium]
MSEPVIIKFGEAALQMRLLTVDQVEEGLRMQAEARKKGFDRSIGACLHDKGHLDLVQIQRVMEVSGHPPTTGRLLPDIELKELLGRGASGAVYRGFNESFGHDVAVKVRAPKIKGDVSEEARFRREAEVGKRLVHDNIVQIFDLGGTRDFTYHIIEYVKGNPLDELLKQQGKLPEKQVIDIGFQVASALECAANEGIVHRDIKPANILLSDDGVAKLCDLGLAKDLNANVGLTVQGMLLGSPYYISPEYAQTGDLDIRSDIYSLGVTLYHCACGVVPFPGQTVLQILEKVIREVAPDPRQHNPALSNDFRTVVLRMIEKQPDKRYQTPTQLATVFKALKEGKSIPDVSKRSFFKKLFGLFGGSQ